MLVFRHGSPVAPDAKGDDEAPEMMVRSLLGL